MRQDHRTSAGRRAPGAALVVALLALAASLQAVRSAGATPVHGSVSSPPPPPSNPGGGSRPPPPPGPPKSPAPKPNYGRGSGGEVASLAPSKAGKTGGGSHGPTSGALGSKPAAGGRSTAGAGYGVSDPFAVVPDAWELWWHDNQDRFLDLRSHLAGAAFDSGAPFPLTGRGRTSGGPTRRASDDVVSREILPVLFEQLETSDDPEVLDSALIALGRSAPDAEANRLLLAARPLLAHEVLSVQTAAVLALGIQGSASYVPLLGNLMADTSAGRAAVGGGAVPTPVRSLAALSLGLGNHEAGVPLLADLVLHLPDAERDLKVCALTALGLTNNAAGDEALRALLGLLGDRRLDSLIKAHVPLAIARLDGGAHAEAVPALLTALSDEDTDDVVRTTCAMALGRLSSAADAGAIELLVQAAADAPQDRTRHAALVALAEIGRRDLPDEAVHAALHDRLAGVLASALESSSTHEDRAWAALAIGLYVRDGARRGPELSQRLAKAYRSQRDPSARGACALALGLAGAADAVPEILEDFRDRGDERLRGYAAVALGLLRAEDAQAELLALCADKSTSPGLREQVAVGLALLGTREVVTQLVDVLQQVEVHTVSVSVARALGRIGDRGSIAPLVGVARADDRQASTRGMACVALGLLGERGALPWNAPLKELRIEDARFAVLDLVLDIL